MFIFLYGKDNYRSRQKLKEIVENYRKIHKSGLNLKHYNEENFNAEDLRNDIRQSSMFGEKKLIVLQNLFSDKSHQEKTLGLLQSLKDSKDIIVLYEEKEIEKSNSLFKFLKKQGKCQEFSLLQGEKLRSWLKKEFEKYNSEISPEALNKLIDFTGNNLWQLSNEIQKLVNFKAGPVPLKGETLAGKEKINVEDVELLVKPKIEADVFKTIDAIAQKNKKQAFSFLHKHLEKGDSPLYLLSMINFQFRNLLIVKDFIEKNTPYYSIAQKSKLHPFVVKKSYEQSKKFSFLELKKIYQKILEVDLSIKTGKVAPETGLDLLIGDI
ncbi:MAG: DNA polymerase III subunit delta [bacterium]|nr:DNA polymerase III subunit delta [bacterium]